MKIKIFETTWNNGAKELENFLATLKREQIVTVSTAAKSDLTQHFVTVVWEDR